MVYEEDFICFGILYDALGDVTPSEGAIRIESQYSTWQVSNGIPIEQMGLSMRTYHCLIIANIRYADEMKFFSKNDFMQIRNLGDKGMREIQEALKRMK